MVATVDARQRIPHTLHCLIYYDDGAREYQGLVRELSIHATGSSVKRTMDELVARSTSYIHDALDEPNSDGLLPRPVSSSEWLKLSIWLTARRLLALVRFRG